MKVIGSKTEALFDWWTVGHVGFFYLVTKLFLVDMIFERAILILIALGFVWEFVERILENCVHTKRFFAIKEGWLNRYVGDIVAMWPVLWWLGLFEALHGRQALTFCFIEL